MSLSVAQFTPGVVYDIEVNNDPQNIRHIAGVEYQLACDLVNSKSADGLDFNLVDNGRIEPVSGGIEYFDMFGGTAKLLNRIVDREKGCFQHVKDALSDPDDWDWAKISIRGGVLDGYACLAIKHDTTEAVVVSLQGMA